MIDYIKGQIVEINPTEVILETYGIGYRILISLQTYEGLNGKNEAKVYIHQTWAYEDGSDKLKNNTKKNDCK